MNIIIAGCGRIGAELALILSKAGHNVVIIDSDAAAFERLGPAFNGVTVRGSACDDRVLRQAGIETCDAFAAATNSDSANIMAAEIASGSITFLGSSADSILPSMRSRSASSASISSRGSS